MDLLKQLLSEIHAGKILFQAENRTRDGLANFQPIVEALLSAERRGLVGNLSPLEYSTAGRQIIHAVRVNRGLTHEGREFLDVNATAELPSSAPEMSKTPTVFISYSHDTREHRIWVGTLAQRLREKGVEVILDQWDIGPGSDVVKFMEAGVRRADRVLMICTEPYVRKANDGKGGVGYEAMIVTGELVDNLGTDKFIPIVRQSVSPKVRPTCVKTRIYVDLSDATNFDEQFEILLRELHDAPAIEKPPLGPNPFTKGQFEGPAAKNKREDRRVEFLADLETPEKAYERATEIIGANDPNTWRKFVLAATERAALNLKNWKSTDGNIPDVIGNDWKPRFEHARRGVECYAPVISILVAAAESSKSGYADQLGWTESILRPADYGPSDSAYFAEFPQIILFVTQAIFGGTLMLGGSGQFEHRFITTKLSDPTRSIDAKPLFLMRALIGWPNALGHNCKVAWEFLEFMVASWTWLDLAFGQRSEVRVAICAHYQMLSFLNFVHLAASDGLRDEMGPEALTVPQTFLVGQREVLSKAYTTLLRQSEILSRLLDANQISQVEFVREWKGWLKLVGKWLGNVFPYNAHDIHVPQINLPDDLRAGENPYSLI